MNIYDDVSNTISEGLNLIFDQKIRIGITGLSRGGKTALITAIVNNVLSFGDEELENKLSRFKPLLSKKIISGQIAKPKDLEIAQFPYHKAIDSLIQNPPFWPEPTDGISKITLEIKAKSKSLLGDKIKTLYVDIWDYPGEWLMDLMLLDLSYEEFSDFYQKRLLDIAKVIDAQSWLSEGASFKLNAKEIDEQKLKRVVDLFKIWLKKVKEYGFAMTLPGRFILPGKLEGTPILEFLPWVWSDVQNLKNSDSVLYNTLKERYEAYRQRVVKRFYNDCFSKIDRQIILVDCLKALRGGKETFKDVNECFDVLMSHFNYGQNNLITRLFKPKIEKVLFVASKADNVTNDEHENLLSLLKSMIKQSEKRVRIGGVSYEALVLSSIKATKCVDYNKDGKTYEVLVTPYKDDQPFYPGSVPPNWSEKSMEFFKEHFKSFELKPPIVEHNDTLPHINLDLLLNFILGDKF
jgi:predicted YcjX-like family ATPase